MRVPGAVSYLWVMLLTTCCAVAAAGARASDAVPMTRETAEKLRAILDEGWPPLLDLIERWRMQPTTFEDFRGRSVRDDLSEFALTAEQQSDIERLRRAVSRQIAGGDWPGAIFEATDAITAVRDVGERLRTVQEYWLFAEREALRQRDWELALGAHRLQDSEAAAKRDLEQKLRERARMGDLVAVVRDDIPAHEAHWARVVESARQAAGVDVLQHDPLRRAPEKACGPTEPVQPADAPAERARIDQRRSQSPASFYPAGALRGGRIGRAAVKVLVTAEGCGRWAELAESSGHPALDDAALRYALDGAAYQPARIDRKPVAATISYRVNFEISGADPILPKPK